MNRSYRKHIIQYFWVTILMRDLCGILHFSTILSMIYAFLLVWKIKTNPPANEAESIEAEMMMRRRVVFLRTNRPMMRKLAKLVLAVFLLKSVEQKMVSLYVTRWALDSITVYMILYLTQCNLCSGMLYGFKFKWKKKWAWPLFFMLSTNILVGWFIYLR